MLLYLSQQYKYIYKNKYSYIILNLYIARYTFYIRLYILFYRDILLVYMRLSYNTSFGNLLSINTDFENYISINSIWVINSGMYLNFYIKKITNIYFSFDLYNCYSRYLNLFNTKLYTDMYDSILVFAFLSFLNNNLILYSEWLPFLILENKLFNFGSWGFFFNYSLLYLFISVLFLLSYYKLLDNIIFCSVVQLNYWVIFSSVYLSHWIYAGEDKVDSLEEILSLVVLWPWSFFLVITHLFYFENFDVIFGFSEWGLPVLYGISLLIEYFWSFGTYILVYLLGIRGRGSSIITFIEDCVTITIMLARILLQIIRGLIVGMFHSICREALLNMIKWWNNEIWFVDKYSCAYIDLSYNYDLIVYFIDLILASNGLVAVMAIMFLQLIFLVVSIWLFCKCWFISWGK